MLDFENEVFSRTKARVLASDPTVTMKGEPEDRPASFPFVSLVCLNSTTYRPTATFDQSLNHVSDVYEIQVYTNGMEGRRAKAKTIMNAALDFLCGDEAMQGLGFLLSYNQPVPNAADSSIHRRVARVEGIIGENKIIYWR